MLKYYNKDKILSISLIDETELKEDNPSLYKKIMMWLYNIKNNKPIDIKNTHNKNGIIFIKPSMEIKFIDNNEILYIYFNSNRERNLYFKRNFQNLNLIINDE